MFDNEGQHELHKTQLCSRLTACISSSPALRSEVRLGMDLFLCALPGQGIELCHCLLVAMQNNSNNFVGVQWAFRSR